MTNNEPKQSEGEVAELKESINSLEDRIEDVNSTKKVVFRGMLSGLSGAIGATVLFALAVTVISTILYQTGLFPGFNEFLSNMTRPR